MRTFEFFDIYRLPSGLTIRTDATATKGQASIAFEVAPVNGRRTFVTATLVKACRHES